MPGRLAATMVVATLLVQAGSATAAGDAPGGPLVVAVAPGGGGTATATTEVTPQGPEPAGPDVSGNPAAPETYDPPFLWTASIALFGLMVLMAVVGGGLYYLMVYRPARRQAE